MDLINKLIDYEDAGREPVLFLGFDLWVKMLNNGDIINDTYKGFPVIRVIDPKDLCAVIPSTFEVDLTCQQFNSNTCSCYKLLNKPEYGPIGPMKHPNFWEKLVYKIKRVFPRLPIKMPHIFVYKPVSRGEFRYNNRTGLLESDLFNYDFSEKLISQNDISTDILILPKEESWPSIIVSYREALKLYTDIYNQYIFEKLKRLGFTNIDGHVGKYVLIALADTTSPIRISFQDTSIKHVWLDRMKERIKMITANRKDVS